MLSIQSHALRPLHSPGSLLGLNELPLKASKEQRRPVHSLSGRLDCLGPSYRRCQLAVLQVVGTLRNLGFLINWEKSVIKPSQRLLWLGVECHSELGLLRPPAKLIGSITEMVKKMKLEEQASRREVEALIGKMAFVGQISEDALFRRKLLGPVLLDWPSGALRDVICRIGAQVLADLGW